MRRRLPPGATGASSSEARGAAGCSASGCGGTPGKRNAVPRMLVKDSAAAQRIGTWKQKCAERNPETPGPTRKPTPKAMQMRANASERSLGVVTSEMYAWELERVHAVVTSAVGERK